MTAFAKQILAFLGINSLGKDTLILIYIPIHNTPTRNAVVGKSSLVGMQVVDAFQ